MLIRVLCLSLLVLFLDQTTKALALRYLSRVTTLPVLPGIFHLTLVRNSGVAFGLLRGHTLMVLLGTTGIILGLVWSVLRQSGPRREGLTMSIGLILGGAVGNLLDRIRRGGGIDFFDFRIWPVFNVADTGITIGAILMAWYLLRRR